MSQNQGNNQNDNLFNFNNQPPQPSSDEPTIFSSGGHAYEAPQPVEPPAPQPSFTPPPPAYAPPAYTPPAYTPPPGPPPQAPAKSKKTWLIVIIILLLLCCCCLALVGIMYQWGGDWFLEQMEGMSLLTSFLL